MNSNCLINVFNLAKEVGTEEAKREAFEIAKRVISEMGNQQPSLNAGNSEEGSTTSDNTSLVECIICGKTMSQMARHLLYVHGISAKEYRNNFKLPTVSKVRREQAIKRNLHYFGNMSFEERQEFTKKATIANQRPASIALREKHRLENLTPDKLSNAGHKRAMKYWEQVRSGKIDDTFRKRRISSTWRKNMSDPVKLSEFVSKVMRIKTKKYVIAGREYMFRSSYEYEFAKSCILLNVDFKYEPFGLPKSDGRTYIPDFVIGNTVVEIKSDHLFKSEENDLRREASVRAGYNYVLLMDKEIFGGNLHSIIGKIATSAQTD